MLYVSPSKAGSTPHDINPINKTEHRMHADSKGKDALMGDFIHQVFCCCDDGISVEQIINLRNSYGFTDKNSTPGNKVQSENDLSSVDALIGVRTGETFIYISVIIVTMLLGGIAIFISYEKLVVNKRKAGV